MNTEKWLERIAANAADIQALAKSYDEWSESYDADMLSIGYMNPAVAAVLVGRHVAASGARLLDAGVGTGALGEVLKATGYADLTGIDISEGMLARARERGTYRELHKRILGEPLGFDDDSFTATLSIGVLAIGHAPPAALDELVRVTRPGGHLIFTIATAPWEEGGFREKVETLESARRWEIIEVAGPYRPMPLSASRAHTTRAFVYRVN